MSGLIPTAEVLRVIDRSDTQLRALRRQGRFMAAHSRERSAFESISRSKQS